MSEQEKTPQPTSATTPNPAGTQVPPFDIVQRTIVRDTPEKVRIEKKQNG